MRLGFKSWLILNLLVGILGQGLPNPPISKYEITQTMRVILPQISPYLTRPASEVEEPGKPDDVGYCNKPYMDEAREPRTNGGLLQKQS